MNTKNEVILKLANGWSIRSGSDNPEQMAGEYVRVCDARGKEVLYWDHKEWQEDPVTVMGAILVCANEKKRLVTDPRRPRRARVGLVRVSDTLKHHGSVTGRVYHRDGNSRGVESVSHHWFCDTCGIPYCGKDVDGGRCSSCMSMITDTRASANGGLDNPIDGGEEHYEVKLAAGDTFSCYIDVEPIAKSIRAVLVDRGVMKDIDGLKVCIASDRKIFVMNKKHDIPVLILTASNMGSEQPGDDD